MADFFDILSHQHGNQISEESTVAPLKPQVQPQGFEDWQTQFFNEGSCNDGIQVEQVKSLYNLGKVDFLNLLVWF